ncbi:MAG: hypothetical protein ACE37K_12775 [Planctomycetota bacterium]
MHPLPTIATLAALLLAAPTLTAQHKEPGQSSSQTYYMVSTEFGSAEAATSLLYQLQGSQGSGVVNEPHAVSQTYQMRGAFYGASTAPVLGQPRLTAARPFFVRRINNGQLSLTGTELWLGPTPTITVGGQNATVITRTVDEIVVSLPDQPEPGFQPVTFSNPVGTTTLEEGVGVLPMLQRREPLNGVDPNYLRIDTLPNNVVLLALATDLGPGIQTLNFGFQLLLDPSSVFFTNAYFVADPDGRTIIPLPPFPPGMLHAQVLDVTADPDDFPGSWTNVVSL